jgi:hypothetical protein
MVRAVLELAPNCYFSVVGDELIWADNEELKPTDEEIELKIKYLLEPEQQLAQMRDERNELLQESDYVMVSDYPHTNKQAWLDYRQALRDLPQTVDLSNVDLSNVDLSNVDLSNVDLSNVVYPTKPL